MSIRNPLGTEPAAGHQFATLGGGCFWCLEAVYEELEGVVDVESGYSGGCVGNPTYRQVCEGDTGHAEVVRLEFDPDRISYAEILEVFFAVHDPTTLNRQGNDVGTQYRSVIFFHTPEQQRVAAEVIEQARSAYGRDVVTQVVPAGPYFRAEDYHQEYFRNNPGQGYCRVVVAPKLEKFRRTFARKRRAATPV
jgi:peptide-methionine (S)-S-oxide reductase